MASSKKKPRENSNTFATISFTQHFNHHKLVVLSQIVNVVGMYSDYQLSKTKRVKCNATAPSIPSGINNGRDDPGSTLARGITCPFSLHIE